MSRTVPITWEYSRIWDRHADRQTDSGLPYLQERTTLPCWWVVLWWNCEH